MIKIVGSAVAGRFYHLGSFARCVEMKRLL